MHGYRIKSLRLSDDKVCIDVSPGVDFRPFANTSEQRSSQSFDRQTTVLDGICGSACGQSLGISDAILIRHAGSTGANG